MEEGGEYLSFGGDAEQVRVEEITTAGSDKIYWKAAIEDHQGDSEVWYTDGSKVEGGQVGVG